MNPLERRVVLHIGYPKTGTSSLQYFLYENREALEELGVHYASTGMASHDLAWSNARSRESSAASVLARDKPRTRIAEAETIIVSSEFFVLVAEPESTVRKLRELAGDPGARVDVIVFVRPQFAYLNSMYCESVKRLIEGRRFRAYLARAINRPHLDYAAHLRKWETDPRTRVLPIPFTPSQLAPDLESRFADTAGLGPRLKAILQASDRPVRNERPGPLTIEVCRRLRGRLAREPETRDVMVHPQMRGKLSRVLTRAVERRLDAPSEPFNAVDNELRDRIDRRFAASNDAFARQHWGARWRDVFATDYARDLAPNEFDPASATSRDRRFVALAVREAQRRANESVADIADMACRKRENGGHAVASRQRR